VGANGLGRDGDIARVDLITGPDGTSLVLEVEVVDPYLSLDMDPTAATRLASALLRR
jgi:hypothetical protein